MVATALQSVGGVFWLAWTALVKGPAPGLLTRFFVPTPYVF